MRSLKSKSNITGVSVALIAAAALFCCVFLCTAKPAYADMGCISYMDWDDTQKKLVEKTGDDACTNYTLVTDSVKTWGEADQVKWYVVPAGDEIIINDRVQCSGNVHLILCDGAKLTVNGIGDDNSNDIIIHGQLGGSGTLNTTGSNIGIYSSLQGSITINGGTVNATGENAEGILAKSVTINGGTVNVLNKDDNYNPAILGRETVTINGGNVTASSGSCGIQSGSGGVTINDGTVIATGTGANTASGIDSGNGIVMIKGGNVVVTGKKYGTEGGGVTVEGGTLNATGTDNTVSCGIYAESSNVTISGGNVTAAGAARAIGIDSQGKLVNAIAGTGWTNTAGTEGKADIATGEHDASALDDYKKLQFPAEAPEPPSDTTPVGSVHNVGGSNYVVTSAGTVSLVKAKSRKSFTIPAAVVIDGKTFSVTGIYAKAFKGKRERTLIIKTKGLTKASVKGSLKGSKVRTVKARVGKKKENKKFVKRYKKFFTKKNCGKKVRVTR